MKNIFLVLMLLGACVGTYAQDLCNCPDTIVTTSPIFKHLLEKTNPMEESRWYLIAFLNEEISNK